MLNYSNKILSSIRDILKTQNTRPLGVLLIRDPVFPNGNTTYSVIVTTTTISLVSPTSQFNVSYVGKSVAQVVSELNTSSLPLESFVLFDIKSLKTGDLLASGLSIPSSFDIEDISNDGKGVIIRTKAYSVANTKTNIISVNSPYREGPALPWYARISYGKFTYKNKGVTYVFGIPEYKNQTWSSQWGMPFIDIEGEPANFISPRVIKTNRNPLFIKNNNIVLAASNNEKTFPSSFIKDIDTINGLIYLKDDISLPDNISLYYTYLEKNLIYKDINLNGHFQHNPFILDKYIVFYLRPIDSTLGKSNSKGLYHSIGISIEAAINDIQEPNLGEPITIIGAIHISPFIDNNDLSITDTRTYGGGLKEDSIGEFTEKKFNQSQYFLDIAKKDGIPYPGAGAIVIELPPELKETLTINEIKSRAFKYLAAGVYPIVRFKEEDYYSSMQENTSYNKDISLVNYNIERAGSTGQNESIFGSVSGASDWINSSLSIPTSGIYGSYTAQNFGQQALVNTGVINNTLILKPGSKYIQPYIKSSPITVFSYEEKTSNGQWKRKTVIDDRTVEPYKLIAGNLEIDSLYGYKEIRNITGFSPFRMENQVSGYPYNLAGNVISIISNLNRLGHLTGSGSFYPIQLQKVTDVISSTTGAINVYGISNIYKPYIEHYSNYTGLGWGFNNRFYTGLSNYFNYAFSGYNSSTLLTGYLDGNMAQTGADAWGISGTGIGFSKITFSGYPVLRIIDNEGPSSNWNNDGVYNITGWPTKPDKFYKLSFTTRTLAQTSPITQGSLRFAMGTGVYSGDYVNLIPIHDFASGTSQLQNNRTNVLFKSSGDIFYMKLVSNHWIGNYYLLNAQLNELSGSFPGQYTNGNNFTGKYYGVFDALDELYITSVRTRQLINEYPYTTSAPISYSSSHNQVTGLPLFQETYPLDATIAQSGAIAIAQAIHNINPLTGAINYITPYYNPYTQTGIAIVTGIPNEIDSTLDQIELQSKYVKAFGAFYTTMVAPAYFDVPRDNNSYRHNIYTPIQFSPRDIVLTGVVQLLSNFSGIFLSPKYNGASLPNTYLTKYHLLGRYGGQLLDDTASAIDSLYYGNNEWAGFKDNTFKNATYHRYFNVAVFNNIDRNWQWDDKLFTGQYTVSISGASVTNSGSYIFQQLPILYKNVLDNISPYVNAQAKLGGILPSGYLNVLRGYIWMLNHIANGDSIFLAPQLNNGSGLLDTFEAGMDSYTKGMISKEGSIVEGYSFKQQFVPMSGVVPAQWFYNCADAIKYYNKVNNQTMALKYKALSEGIFRTSTGLYYFSGGYQSNPYDNGTIREGDPGYRQIGPYIYLLNQLTGFINQYDLTGYYTGTL